MALPMNLGASPCRFCLSARVHAVRTSHAGRPLMRCIECGGFWFSGDPDLPAYQHRMHVRERRPDYDYAVPGGLLGTLESHLGRSQAGGGRRMVGFGSRCASVLKWAQNRGMEAVCAGANREAARHIREALGVETCDLEEVRDDSCDIIYAGYTVEHRPDPASVLQNLASKLRKGGILAMASPCCSDMLARSDALRLYEMAYPRSLSYFTLRAAEKIMEHAGLEIDHSKSELSSGGQALRSLCDGLEGGAGNPDGADSPFHTGTLLAVGRKARHENPSTTQDRTIKVTRLSTTRCVHHVLSGEVRVPLPPGRSVVSGSVTVLATAGIQPVAVGLEDQAAVQIRPNSGPRPFVFENDGSGGDLVVRGEQGTDVFLHDLLSTAS